MLYPYLSFLLLLLSSPTPTAASKGDRSPAYQTCIATCVTSSTCLHWKEERPWSLTWSRWSCADDCSYRCAQSLTDLALGLVAFDAEHKVAEGDELGREEIIQKQYGVGGKMEGLDRGRMVQFHGKWPLKRWMGIQEPLSVLFSICNAMMHYRGFRLLRSSRSRNGLTSRRNASKRAGVDSVRTLYERNAFIGMNLWFWSTIFHTRDKPMTEKGDYFSASFGMLYGLYLFNARVQGYYAEGQARNRYKTGQIYKFIAITLFIAHCSYLTLWKFDYGYNMIANSTIGVLQIVGWISWTGYHYFFSSSPSASTRVSTSSSSALHRSRPPHYLSPVLPLLLLLLASSFELLDFAPKPQVARLLDAHALWHAGTIGVVGLWYRFLKKDLDWVERRGDDAERGMKS